MDEQAEQYDGILEDDALAPLKRNHACLQCKKRKVKCDATKPTCSPCLRSHAHAVRAAQRNNSVPPILTCTYADGDAEDDSSGDGEAVPGVMSRKNSGDKEKKNAAKKVSSVKAGIFGTGNSAKAKEKRLEEERDLLKLRIAELEKNLASQTPSTSTSSLSAIDNNNPFSSASSIPKASPEDYRLPSASNPLGSGNPFSSISDQIPQLNSSFSATRVEDAFDQAWPANGNINNALPQTTLGTAPNMIGNMDLDWDIGGLFMVPAHWPMNLPSPFLLEHLIETFFNCVPQIPRMIHKGNLLYRSRLAPTNKNFPHPALLHAICALAAPHTAWVNSTPPDLMEETATRAISSGQNLEEIEDFGLAQAFAARRAMDQSATCCAMGSGQLIFELVQSSIILSEVFFLKGMPLQGWLTAGIAPRLIKSLELGNRNHGFKRPKEPMLPPPKNAIEREERIATVWMSHIQDSGFAINSYWSQSMDWRELKCPLPTSTEQFRKKDAETMLENPQTAHTPDVLTEHPVPDTFLLVVKASLLMSRTAKWLQEWHQREMHENDELEGLTWPSFIQLISDIHAFQQSIPAATRNVFRILHQPASGFDSNLLLVHILPNIALCLVHEPFVDWNHISGAALGNVQRSYEAVVGMLHLVPSNLDVSLVMTPLLAFSLYTTGRIVANFMQKALDVQSFGLAVRYRADLTAIQSLLGRFGQKHTLGGAMSSYLDTYLRTGNKDPTDPRKGIVGACLNPATADSYPVEDRSNPSANASANDTVGSGASAMNIDTLPHAFPLNPNPNMGGYTAGSAESAFQDMLNNFASQSQGPSPIAQQQPQQRQTSLGSGSGSYASSSSKATPESATLVDPMPMLFDMTTDQFADFGKGHTMLGYMPQSYQGH